LKLLETAVIMNAICGKKESNARGMCRWKKLMMQHTALILFSSVKHVALCVNVIASSIYLQLLYSKAFAANLPLV
jgi:hypothetical protein